MDDRNSIALRAVEEPVLRERFIQENTGTILRIASKKTGRYITVNDDEWSVALYAFNKSIDTYDDSKGEFISYASVVIEKALIDHYRKGKKFSSEVSYAPDVLTGDSDMEETDSTVYRAISDASIGISDEENRRNDIREEIMEVNSRLKKYGFSFYDIADCSPKAGKTKKECARVIAHILYDDKLTESIEENGRLPVGELASSVKVSRKLLDRYRRYIVMAVIVLNGEYPLLADYLEYVRKEGG